MFYDYINTIYQFIKAFLDNNMSTFEEYGAFKKVELGIKTGQLGVSIM